LEGVIILKQEARMKKLTILFLALIIAVPAMSYAGSATSRWDLVIGGMVKFDVGWVDHVNRSAFNTSRPEPRAGQSNNNWNRGTTFMNANETAISFFIKGPDALGAKTSALILADFSGGWNSSMSGNFNAEIVKMQFDWPTTTLEMGVFPTMLGMYPLFSGNIIGFGMGNMFGKGYPSAAQVNVTQKFGKNFSAAFGVIQYGGPAFQSGPATTTSGRIDNFTEYGVPGVQSMIQYNSDSCGKVGPWGLNVRLGGAYARQRVRDAIDDANVDSYYAELAWTIPIIPEKQGHKRNALLFAGSGYQYQGSAGLYGAAPGGIVAAAGEAFVARPFARIDGEWSRPVTNGVQGMLQYYWTDSLYSMLWYGQTHASVSRRYTTAFFGEIQNQQMIVANIMYNASDAVRLGLEWDHVSTSYTGTPIAAQKRHGRTNALRVGAYYFF
jgi:hypothetical protein